MTLIRLTTIYALKGIIMVSNGMPVQFNNGSPQGYSYLVLSRKPTDVVDGISGGW